MDYRYLKAFLTAAHRLSFTQAARDLGVTQAAISRQIRLLEESVGLQLIIRSPQRVQLTPEGERLFEESRRLDRWIRDDLQTGTQTIRVATLQGILESWLVDLIARHFKVSSTNFFVKTGTLARMDAEIRGGHVDIAITARQVQGESLTSFKLFKERIVAVSKRPIDLTKLADYPWVTFDPETYLVPYCGRLSKRIIQVESINAQWQLTRAGVGVTMLPHHLVPESTGLHVYPIERFKNEFLWATLLDYTKPPTHLRDFVQLMRKEAVRA